jgi:hypothetical protein
MPRIKRDEWVKLSPTEKVVHRTQRVIGKHGG